MQRLTGLLILSFWLTIASILVGRGFYFFTDHIYGFTPEQNLGVAVGYGVCYVAGALLSHRIVLRWQEKRTLLAMIVGFAAVLLTMTFGAYSPAVSVTAFVLSSFFIGGAWPVVESFISAGRSVTQTHRAVGRFNLTWSGAFPFPVAAAGVLIENWERGLFLVPAVIALAVLPVLRPLPMHPTHLALDDPNRPPADELQRLRRQLLSARLLMLLSYSLIFVLVPIFPDILRNELGLDVRIATVLASTVDVARFLMFALMHAWGGWHGHRRWLVTSAALMPAGFFMTLLGQDVATVLAGALLFGSMHGIAYYAALHYAMVVQNASVEAGGVHEGLIGFSFALGPAAALLGQMFTHPVARIVPLAVLILLCTVPAMLALRMKPPSVT